MTSARRAVRCCFDGDTGGGSLVSAGCCRVELTTSATSGRTCRVDERSMPAGVWLSDEEPVGKAFAQELGLLGPHSLLLQVCELVGVMTKVICLAGVWANKVSESRLGSSLKVSILDPRGILIGADPESAGSHDEASF